MNPNLLNNLSFASLKYQAFEMFISKQSRVFSRNLFSKNFHRFYNFQKSFIKMQFFGFDIKPNLVYQ